MNVVPIADCLRNFSTAPAFVFAQGNGGDLDGGDRSEACRRASLEGFAAGQLEAKTALAADFDRRLADAVAQLEERTALAAARAQEAQAARWSIETASCLQIALDRVENQIAAQVAEALRPVIEDAGERASIADIVRHFSRLTGGRKARLSVSGPPHLVDRLAKALPELTFDISYTSQIDLNFQVDETELSTRLADWRQHYLEGRT